MEREPVIIIGGGVTGLCTAYYLARRGEPVSVISREPVGDSASGGNAGILAAGHLPLPRPGLARKALRWMLDRESPLYIPPRFDPALLRWFWDFNLACSQSRIDRSMEILAPLGFRTMECWRELMANEALACDFRPRGWLNVHCTEKGRREAEEEADLVEALGFDVVRYSGPELRSRESAFAGAATGAVHFRDSASVDPKGFMEALADRLSERGVEIHIGEEASRLILDQGRCLGVETVSGREIRGSRTVLAAGAWSTGLARGAGLKLPLQGGKGYHLDLDLAHPGPGTPAVLLEKAIAVTPMNGRLRLAGTVEFSGLNRDLVLPRLKNLSDGASGYLEGIRSATVLEQGCDLRPCTADGLPVLGWAPKIENLLVSTGGAKLGMTLGPVLGKLGAELLLDGKPSFDISVLRADRF